MSHSPRARSSSAMSVGGHNAEVASIVARVAFDRFPDHIGPWSTSAHDPGCVKTPQARNGLE